MTIDSQDKDEQVLAQFYKQGAKETPPAKLNSEIINYAADASKKTSMPASENNHVGSHFGGGWKVPLSLAASVVVVFALLVQIDQSPQQLELPPIPEISIPSKSKSIEDAHQAEEAIANDAPLFKQDDNESDLDSHDAVKSNLPERRANKINEQETVPPSTQTRSTADKKAEQKQSTYRERTDDKNLLEKDTLSDDIRPQDELRSNEVSSPKLSKPSAAKKQLEINSEAGATQPSTIDENPKLENYSTGRKERQQESPQEKILEEQESSEIGASDALDNTTEDFAPIPVEDWLLMIEKLIAKKDYAEAARQLQKFKQTHPKVNVEDLDSKIP
ncbi:MAG: hypothetical protein ACRBDX_05380 [Gammaproteobacteria bacterium]